MINQLEKSMEILLVEDNSTDVFLTEEALASAKIANRLHIVDNGVKALSFLRKQGAYTNVPRPNIILLDLNLPIKHGSEVLAEIKADADLRYIPVIVLSTSSQELDVFKAYNLSANCYIVKPVNFYKFREVLKAIQSFWFTVVTLPS